MEKLTPKERSKRWNAGGGFKGLTFDECLKLCYNWSCCLAVARKMPDDKRPNELALLHDINPAKIIGYQCAVRMQELGIIHEPEWPELNLEGFFLFLREESRRSLWDMVMSDELRHNEHYRNQSI